MTSLENNSSTENSLQSFSKSLKYQSRVQEIKTFLDNNPGISKRKAAEKLKIPQASFRKVVRDFSFYSYFTKEEAMYKNFTKIFTLHPRPISATTAQRSLRFLLNQGLSEDILKQLDPSLDSSHRERYIFVKYFFCWCCGKEEHYGNSWFLELDHISGDITDYRLSNLRLICPCCHKSTSTHGRRKRLPRVETGTVQVYSNFLPEINIHAMNQSYKKSLKKKVPDA